MAESFGYDAARYDRARPSYPGEMVDRIFALSPGADVLDVGCGTGIVSRQFRAVGCRVLGVDVDERMALFARSAGLEVEVSTLEAWDPAGRRFDAVVCGQAWHWVQPVAGAAKAASVLRPQGRLAVFWNVAQPPAEVARELSAVYRRVLPGSPFADGVLPGIAGYSEIFTRATDGMLAVSALGEPERWLFDWQREYTRDEWLDRVPTFSGHSALRGDQLEELLHGTAAAIDALGGGFTMSYTTAVITARHERPT